jgi:Tol biopolymer transport system component
MSPETVGRILLVLLAAGVCTAAAWGSGAAGRGANGRIVYANERGFVLLNPDGTGATHVPGTSGRDRQPAWSPDGRQLLFESTRRGSTDVYLMSGDGRFVRELTFADDFDGDPSWSPDSQRVVFESRRTGNDELWTMLRDGRSQRQLTNFASRDTDPAWSPRGDRIAFTTGAFDRGDIAVIGTDGGGFRALTGPATSGIFSQNPASSPDGSRIAFDSNASGDYEIWVMTRTAPARRLTDSPGPDNLPAWSPDGTRIVFQSERAGRGVRRVYSMRVDGSDVRRLTAGRSDVSADWQALGPRPAGCTIWGTTGHDLLTGTAGRDVICGGSGDDRIRGSGGADVLLGGSGGDTLLARDGRRDVVDGGLGRDGAQVDRADVVRSVERRL